MLLPEIGVLFVVVDQSVDASGAGCSQSQEWEGVLRLWQNFGALALLCLPYGSLNSFVKGSEGRSYRVQLTCPLLPCQLPVELLDTPRVEEAKVEVSYRLSKTVLRIYLVPS